MHFLRFELTEAMIKDFCKADIDVFVGVDHPEYNEVTKVNTLTKEMLIKDFDEKHALKTFAQLNIFLRSQFFAQDSYFFNTL